MIFFFEMSHRITEEINIFEVRSKTKKGNERTNKNHFFAVKFRKKRCVLLSSLYRELSFDTFFSNDPIMFTRVASILCRSELIGSRVWEGADPYCRTCLVDIVSIL